ncbi:MAG: PAS domain S-box protein [Deltaproteobacteria bacterium]|nr:PAS domain S-box protein [Deltaproteobacteria bacterium]
MKDKKSPATHIALVGGRTYCKELLEKTNLGYMDSDIKSHIVAVSDPSPDSPGIVLAKKLGLKTVSDYYELYLPENHVDLIIILTPGKAILEDILATKPDNIRAMSYNVFEIFWKAIGVQERKLRERNEEVETILNGIQDFIIVITPDKEIVETNEAFLHKMGYTSDEVIGRKCYEIFQGENNVFCNSGDIRCPLNEVIKNKRYNRQVVPRLNRDGEIRHFEVSIFPIWEKDGKISKFIEVSRDITKRKKEAEEITRRLEQMVEERTRELKETHAKLLHQDKMASLGKLSASVVHEINNPIAGILNLTKLLKRVTADGSIPAGDVNDFNQYLELMETETWRVSRIVSNLLTFSRQSEMGFKKVNINRLIEKTLILNSNLLMINQVRVKEDLDPNLPELIGSEDQLQQVFINFISNAAEAMELTGDGVLSIKTSHYPDDNKITVSFQDNGIGIPEENLSRLFEPFFSTKKKGKGVGLGLSVAYGIIEEHGGSINVDSKEGEYTTFNVEFPLKHPLDSVAKNGGAHGQH